LHITKNVLTLGRQWLSPQEPMRDSGQIFELYTSKPLESAIDLTKPKYLVTSSKGSRYHLEEIVIAGYIHLFGKSKFFLITSKGRGFQIKKWYFNLINDQ